MRVLNKSEYHLKLRRLVVHLQLSVILLVYSKNIAPLDEHSDTIKMAELAALIKQLQLNAAKCDSIIAQGNSERIKRQQDALKQLAVVVDKKRRQMEHNKIAANEDLTDVMAWSEKVEEEIARADVQIELLAKHMRENKRKAEAEERNSVLAFEKAQGEQSLTNKARFGPKLYKASLPNQRHQLHQHHNKRQKPNCPKSR